MNPEEELAKEIALLQQELNSIPNCRNTFDGADLLSGQLGREKSSREELSLEAPLFPEMWLS